MLVKKNAIVQFKFLFSLIFSVFLFLFLFFFLAKTIILYQEFAIISLYTSITTLIDVISLKKNTASIVEITKGRNFKIEIKDNEMIVRVFFRKKTFPLYGKLVVANTIETNRIYYETKPVFLPFYVGSITYLIPLEKKSKNNVYLITYKNPFTYRDVNELMKIMFPVEGITEDLPFFKDKLKNFLEKDIKSKTLRILILNNDTGKYQAFNEIGRNIDKIKNSDYEYFWIVSAKPLDEIDDYFYKLVVFEKKLSKRELIRIFKGVGSPVVYEFYIPKEFLLASLMVNSQKELEKLLENFYKKAYFSYLSYSNHKKDLEFTSICQIYTEIDSIIKEIEDTIEKRSSCGFNNLTLCIKDYIKEISIRNSKKSLSDKPICTLY